MAFEKQNGECGAQCRHLPYGQIGEYDPSFYNFETKKGMYTEQHYRKKK
jgi:hypothetical protein